MKVLVFVQSVVAIVAFMVIAMLLADPPQHAGMAPPPDPIGEPVVPTSPVH
jgi:hypothetical protein